MVYLSVDRSSPESLLPCPVLLLLIHILSTPFLCTRPEATCMEGIVSFLAVVDHSTEDHYPLPSRSRAFDFFFFERRWSAAYGEKEVWLGWVHYGAN